MISALAGPRRYGWKKDKEKGKERDFKFMLPERTEELPKSVDLQKYMPPVYDQGSLGSCTGQAIAAALQYDQEKQGQRTFRPSRLFIYYNERVLEGSIDDDAGAEIRDGLRVVVNFGAPPEEIGRPGAWPYHVSRFKVKPPAASYNEASNHQALIYRRVKQTKNDILGALAAGYPVIYGFSVYPQFESDEAAKTGTIYMPHPSDELLGGHAVLATGYDLGGYNVDDGIRVRTRNSWSEKWGDGGYFTIPLDYLLDRDLSNDFWTISRVE